MRCRAGGTSNTFFYGVFFCILDFLKKIAFFAIVFFVFFPHPFLYFCWNVESTDGASQRTYPPDDEGLPLQLLRRVLDRRPRLLQRAESDEV